MVDGASRAPAHLWIVGVVSTLWNIFGCVDYLMTQTRNEAWLAQLTDAQRAYVDSYPAWTEAAWAFGVWGAMAGSLLLLARSRHAVTAFAVSLAGLAVSTLYQYVLSPSPAEMRSGAMLAIMITIWVVAIVLFLYVRRVRAQGVLR